MGYDYPTFLTVNKLQENKRLSKSPLHVLQSQIQCDPLCHDGTHNHPHPLPRHTICLCAFRPWARRREGVLNKNMVCREGLDG